MRIVRWLFGTIQGVSASVLLLGGAVLTIFELGDRLNGGGPAPQPPALPDTVPVAFSAPLAARLADAFAAASCAPGVVAATDYVERITTADGRDAAFLQLGLATPAAPINVQGNGRGAAALANARANLLDNIEIALKESDACG